MQMKVNCRSTLWKGPWKVSSPACCWKQGHLCMWTAFRGGRLGLCHSGLENPQARASRASPGYLFHCFDVFRAFFFSLSHLKTCCSQDSCLLIFCFVPQSNGHHVSDFPIGIWRLLRGARQASGLTEPCFLNLCWCTSEPWRQWSHQARLLMRKDFACLF